MELDVICPYCGDVTYIDFDPHYYTPDFEYACWECMCIFTADIEFEAVVTPKRIDE